MVYNNPVSYGVDITPAMFAELADEPKFVAIKESSENVRRITDLQERRAATAIVLFCGVDDLVLESIAARRDRLGLRPGQRLPRREPPALGPGDWRASGRRRCKVYRWYTPLLHLDTHPKLVQYIKLAIGEKRGTARKPCGRRGCRWWARSARRFCTIINDRSRHGHC